MLLSQASSSSPMPFQPPTPRRRTKYPAARPFLLTILVISALALWSSVVNNHAHHPAAATQNLSRRALGINDPVFIQSAAESHDGTDSDCNLVHSAQDKCKFVRENCPDEEAGYFSYLQLYYCRLHHAKPVAFVIMTLWLGLLFSTIGIAASDFFCINLSTIANILGLSESVAGVTFLAFGNGSPDVFSTYAAMNTHSGSLAIGELIGAAGFITAVVAGSMALVRPFKVARRSFLRDVGFFIVAASFSMVFLADGHLYLWECAVMVGFYFFYVITVWAWHWYRSRKRRSRIREAAARADFQAPGADGAEVEIYVDDEGDGVTGGHRTPLRAPSAEDFANLERGGSPAPQLGVDDDSHLMAELSNSMRVSRPRPGERRHTIRPSLVGALEFRAVLSSLQKSRNMQSIPIDLRRYSDDPTSILGSARYQDQSSTTSNPEIHCEPAEDLENTSSSALRPGLGFERRAERRGRAISANGAAALSLDPNSFHGLSVPAGDWSDSARSRSGSRSPNAVARAHGTSEASRQLLIPEQPVSPLESIFGYRSTSPAPLSPRGGGHSSDLLAPPEDGHGGSSAPPGTQGSTPASPFPEYHDDPDFISRSRASSLRLPPPSIGPGSSFHQNVFEQPQPRRFRWWPYRFLPAPQVLASTLFPTLYSWHDKNVWEKLLGIVAAPTMLLLVLTLPVVEADKKDELPVPVPELLTPEPTRSRSQSTARNPLYTDTMIEPVSPSTVPAQNGAGRAHNETKLNLGPQGFSDPNYSSPEDWNRWLICTQLFTGPFFVVILYWGATDPQLSGRNLLLLVLYALLFSLGFMAILLLTTTPERPPQYRYMFCFLGFAMSVAWISTIASEVVGVLKAFGVILGISDAILGLTIFAVGNSLGDLVADITVARLGYPVMALSACFGGPMLNILLGIGISGLLITIRSGQGAHRHHPNKPTKYKPYQIDVGGTLIISGVTLLVTLLGLLVLVPLNGWKMDRKIGWGLIALWSASTIGNVIVEVLGWDGRIA